MEKTHSKQRRHRFMILYGIITAIILIGIGAAFFLNLPRFGRLPQGERLERIKKSPNYIDGQFRNREHTEVMTSDDNRFKAMWNFLFKKKERLTPDGPMVAVKTDLKSLPSDEDWIVWFGHSSYLLNISGKKILVDPVFYAASPVSFINKPFKGTDLYRPEDMPDIDYLVITHDHWDHLDARTIEEMKNRVSHFICPLGVGEHLEYWGVDPDRLIELDWDENATPERGWKVNCLTSRHFTGRGLTSNKTLWASFMFETPSGNILIGGDGGYGKHFKETAARFGKINLAILENGQYDKDWAQIHTMPDQLRQVVTDLNAEKVVTVHHSKYALAKHPWDEPLTTEKVLKERHGFNILIPTIGEALYINDSNK